MACRNPSLADTSQPEKAPSPPGTRAVPWACSSVPAEGRPLFLSHPHCWIRLSRLCCPKRKHRVIFFVLLLSPPSKWPSTQASSPPTAPCHPKASTGSPTPMSAQRLPSSGRHCSPSSSAHGQCSTSASPLPTRHALPPFGAR